MHQKSGHTSTPDQQPQEAETGAKGTSTPAPKSQPQDAASQGSLMDLESFLDLEIGALSPVITLPPDLFKPISKEQATPSQDKLQAITDGEADSIELLPTPPVEGSLFTTMELGSTSSVSLDLASEALMLEALLQAPAEPLSKTPAPSGNAPSDNSQDMRDTQLEIPSFANLLKYREDDAGLPDSMDNLDTQMEVPTLANLLKYRESNENSDLSSNDHMDALAALVNQAERASQEKALDDTGHDVSTSTPDLPDAVVFSGSFEDLAGIRAPSAFQTFMAPLETEQVPMLTAPESTNALRIGANVAELETWGPQPNAPEARSMDAMERPSATTPQVQGNSRQSNAMEMDLGQEPPIPVIRKKDVARFIALSDSSTATQEIPEQKAPIESEPGKIVAKTSDAMTTLETPEPMNAVQPAETNPSEMAVPSEGFLARDTSSTQENRVLSVETDSVAEMPVIRGSINIEEVSEKESSSSLDEVPVNKDELRAKEELPETEKPGIEVEAPTEVGTEAVVAKTEVGTEAIAAQAEVEAKTEVAMESIVPEPQEARKFHSDDEIEFSPSEEIDVSNIEVMRRLVAMERASDSEQPQKFDEVAKVLAEPTEPKSDDSGKKDPKGIRLEDPKVSMAEPRWTPPPQTSIQTVSAPKSETKVESRSPVLFWVLMLVSLAAFSFWLFTALK